MPPITRSLSASAAPLGEVPVKPAAQSRPAPIPLPVGSGLTAGVPSGFLPAVPLKMLRAS
jgi:hypothetical protein